MFADPLKNSSVQFSQMAVFMVISAKTNVC